MSKNTGKVGSPGGINKTGKFAIPEPQGRAGTGSPNAFNALAVAGAGTLFKNQLQIRVGDYLWDATLGMARRITEIYSDTRLNIDRPWAKQSFNFVPADVEIDDIFTIRMPDGSTISFVATAGTVANVTAGLKAAWDLELDNDFTKFATTDNGTDLQVDAKSFNDFVEHSDMIVTSTTDGGGTDDQTLTKNILELGGISAAEPIRVIKNAQLREVGVLVEGIAGARMFDEQQLADGTNENYKNEAGLGPVYGDAGASTVTIQIMK